MKEVTIKVVKDKTGEPPCLNCCLKGIVEKCRDTAKYLELSDCVDGIHYELKKPLAQKGKKLNNLIEV